MSFRRNPVLRCQELVCDTCGKARLVAPAQTPMEAEAAAALRGWVSPRGHHFCSDCIAAISGGAA